VPLLGRGNCHSRRRAFRFDSELTMTDPELQTKIQALEQDRLNQFICQAFPGQMVESFAHLGEPGSVIAHLVQEQRADLVMLATRGHGPVRRFLLGAVTAKVLHDVRAAVWTGPGSRTIGASRAPALPIHCLQPWMIAAKRPQFSKRRLSLPPPTTLNCPIPSRRSNPPSYPDVDLSAAIKTLIGRAHLGLRELKAQLGVDAPYTVVDALLEQGIHQEVARRKADLLVTGRGHAIGTFSRVLSHLYPVIRDSPCPVLSL